MDKYAQKILHFYCYTCKDYEPKTGPHYGAQRQRFARPRRKEGAVSSPSLKALQPQIW